MNWQRALACLFVWLQAGLIWSCWAVIAIPVAGAVAALLGAARLLAVPLPSWRWPLLLVVLAAALALTRTLFAPPESELPGSVWGVLLAEFLMLMQAAELCRRHQAGAALPPHFVGLGLASAWLSLYHTIQMQAAGTLINGALVACLLAALLYDSSFGARCSPSHRAARLRRRLTLAVMVLTTLVAAPAAWQLSVRVARAREEAVDMLMGRVAHRRSVLGFGTNATLHSVASEKQSNPLNVVLRVYASRAPGYLRGRAYGRYDGWRWRPPRHVAGGTPALSEPPAGLRPAPGGQRLYALQAPSSVSAWTRIEVHNDPMRESPICFLPLHARVLQGVGGRVRVDSFRNIRGGLETRRPYFAYVADKVPAATLDESVKPDLTTPPVDRPPLRRLAQRVCPDSLTPRQKMEAVAAFFRENFEYSLDGFEASEEEDELTYFLLHRPASHCEFFASGATTLLRMQGVPCRYVVGYLVTELEGEYGDYWVARNRDAHAWVEAYDQQSQHWQIVEATPGVNLPEEAASAATDGGSGQAAGAISYFSDQRWLRRWFRAARVWLASPACGWTIAVTAPVVLLVLAAWRAYVRRPANEADRVRQQHRALNRRLRRRKLIRGPSETLHQFADRIRRSAQDDPFLQQAAAWQRRYAEFCYGRRTGLSQDR